MADSLTVGVARMYAEMTSAQVSQHVQAKAIKSELQQAQALVQMLEEQSKAIPNLTYSKSGAAAVISIGSKIDKTA